MALDPNGEWGLRHRVRLAWNAVNSYEVVAAFLLVDASVIEQFLTDPTYVPTGTDLTLMQDNLPALELDEPSVYSPSTNSLRYTTTLETPIWTEALLAGVEVPGDAVRFRFRLYGAYPPYNTSWSGWYFAATDDIQQSAYAEVGDDYTQILSIQFLRAGTQ